MLRKFQPGTVVEFFEAKEIVCGVCLACKNQRLNVLTQHNREINLALEPPHSYRQPAPQCETDPRRIGAEGSTALPLCAERSWSVRYSRNSGRSSKAKRTGSALRNWPSLSLPRPSPTIMRRRCSGCLLQERLFFQFKDGDFYANSQEKIEQRRLEIEREKEKEIRARRGFPMAAGRLAPQSPPCPLRL